MPNKKRKFKRQRFCELTTAQWQDIKEMVDNGRKRKYNLLAVMNAILRITRPGLQWRNLEEIIRPGTWCITTFASGKPMVLGRKC